MDKESRPNWDNQVQFVMACVSYVVGIGTVWRFPYLCQMHGGGGFMIPYVLMLILEGIPLFYMELAIGQKLRQGSIGAWTTISPYMRGVGLASVVTSIYLILYFNVINAWSFWYLFNSFTSVVPWSTCPVTANGTLEECSVATSTQYFFYRETLNTSPTIDYNGGVHMGQALCLLLAWVLSYLLVSNGVKSTGKAVYVTATFPYLVLSIYLFRGLTLHGATNGIVFLFTPKMEELANPLTWINAATQIFFSLGMGFGSLIAFSSYNQYHNNFQRQTLIVSCISIFTSLFVSVVTFAIYGFKATVNFETCLDSLRLLLTNTFDLAEDLITRENVLDWVETLNSSFPLEFAEIADKVEKCSLNQELSTAVEGSGLAYIVYSEAIMNMPLPQLWSVLYFLMLLMVGMGSMMGNMTAIVTPLREFKMFSHINEALLNGLLCIFCFLLGLGFTTPSGNYWLTIFNDYGTNFSLLFVVLIELVALRFIYGLNRFYKDIEDMLGHRPNWYFRLMLGYVSPLLLVAVVIFYIVNYIMGGTPTYQAWDKDLGQSVIIPYPMFGQAMIGLLIVSSVMCVPLTALYIYFKRRRPGARAESA